MDLGRKVYGLPLKSLRHLLLPIRESILLYNKLTLIKGFLFGKEEVVGSTTAFDVGVFSFDEQT